MKKLKKAGEAYVCVQVGGNDHYEFAYKLVKVTIEKADLSKAKVTLSPASYTYDGGAKKPAVRLVLGGKALDLKANADYDVSYANNKKAGTARVTVTGKGSCTGEAPAWFTIAKAKNSLSVSTEKTAVKASKKARTVKPIVKAKPKFKAAVTYAKAKRMSGYKVLTVAEKTGKVTVKAGARPGTYKLMVKVSAAKTANTKAASKTVTVTVKVTAKAKASKLAKSTKAQHAASQTRGSLAAATVTV